MLDKLRRGLAGWLMRSYPPNWMARLFSEWQQSSSGIAVTSESALKCAAFYSAIDLISRTVASLPLRLYQRISDSERRAASKHPLYVLLHTRPNPEQTAFTFRQTLQSWVLRWGNGYAEIVRNPGGRPIALWPMRSDRMKIERDGDGALIYVYTREDNREAVIPAADVLHIRTMGDGIMGKSPVTLFRESIGLALAAEQTGASFFGNAMRPSGVLEHPNKMSQEAQERFKAQMEKAHSGTANTGRLLVLEEGMVWKALGVPPDDAQFLETRTFQVRDIARVFHVPPHKLADMADATFSNVEEQNIEFVTDCLQPWLINWEQEINFKLLMENERDKYYSEFLIQGLLRGNAQARSEFYSKLFNIGALSINDIRALENMNGIGEPGEVHYVPLNMISAEKAMKMEPPTKPVTAPEKKPEPKPEDDNPDEPKRALLMATCERVSRMLLRSTKKNGEAEPLLRRASDILTPVLLVIQPGANAELARNRVGGAVHDVFVNRADLPIDPQETDIAAYAARLANAITNEGGK